jgi:hypothetical protein
MKQQRSNGDTKKLKYISIVQECDATMYKRITSAHLKNIALTH